MFLKRVSRLQYYIFVSIGSGYVFCHRDIYWHFHSSVFIYHSRTVPRKVSLSEFHILALFLFHHITHTVSLSLSLSHHQTNTLVSISFLSHRYTSKMFHLLSTVIQSFLFLHKQITLTFYLPFPFLVHPLYAFNSHWTLPNFSFLCLSLFPLYLTLLSPTFIPISCLNISSL